MNYVQRSAEPPLVKMGDCRGAMTSELKPGCHIEEFVSCGPKNYAYRIVDPVTCNREKMCKVRGITLIYSASQTVKFDVMKPLILKGDDNETVTALTEHKIKCKREDGGINILTDLDDKIHRVSFLKRWRLCDNTSVPFGYV